MGLTVKTRTNDVEHTSVYAPHVPLAEMADLIPRLNARRDQLQQQIGSLEPYPDWDEGYSQYSRDLADAMQAWHQQQNMAAVRAILLDELQQIEQVLQRAARGVYGICEDCGNAIPLRRLRVVPAATLCVRCQGMRESQRLAR